MSSMAGARRRALALAVALLVVPSLPMAAPAGAAPSALAGAQVDLNLWIHRDDSLSMASNQNELGIAPFTSHTWRQVDALQKDLCIEGVDIGGGRFGIAVELGLGFNTFTSGLNVTMRVLDVDFALAEGTFAFAQGSTPANTFWNLNFTAQRTGCTVLKGRTLALEITGSKQLTTATFNGAHIAFRATDPLAPTARTSNAAGPTSLFYPNDLPANRSVIFDGTLGNAFTDALVARVAVQVRDPANALVLDATGAVATGNWSYTWNYPPSAAGSYSALIQVNDTQGHSYNVTVSFTFADYGLRMTTAGQTGDSATRYTTPGVSAAFDITVTNIGGQPTIVALSPDATPPGWSTSLSANNLPVDPAASAQTTFTVSPSAGLGPGNSTQVTLTALATADPAPLKARATLVTRTIIQSEISLVIDPPRTDSNVKLADRASYDFTLRNNGGLATDILLNATAAPSGWDRGLTGPAALSQLPDGSWRLAGVEAGGERVLTLWVDAPAQSGNQTLFECTVTARATENASAVATFVATTRLLLGIELAQISEPAKPTLLPGAFVDIEVEISNTDPLNDHVVTASDLSFTEAATNPWAIDGNDGGAITISPPIGCCAQAGSPGDHVSITVTVQVPTHARAGTYVFTVFAQVDHNPAVVAQLNLSILVDTVVGYYLRLDGNPSQVALKGGAVTMAGAIVSTGNSRVAVSVEAGVFDGATSDITWTVKITSNGTDINGRVDLFPYEVKPVEVTITASPQAFNGERRDLKVRLSRAFTGNNPWELAPPVLLTVELEGMAVLTRMWQAAFLVILPFLFLSAFAFFYGRRALARSRPAAPPAGPPPPGPPAPPPVT